MSGAYAAAVSGHGHHSVLAPGPLGHGAGGSPFDDDVPPWTPFNDALFPGGGGGLALWDAADGEGPLHAGALRLEDEVPLGAPRGSGIEPQVGEGSLAATPVWRCLLCAPLAPGAAPCTRCAPPPAEDQVDDYQLVGEPGQKNGEKLLRSGLVGCPEWQSAEVREETAREALRHGHPTLADALRAKDSAKLRKRQYIWLCRRWGYASWVWQHKDTEGFARQARGVSARATAPGAGSSAQVTPLRRSLSHKTITVMDDGEEQPRGSSRRRLSSRQPSTGGVHTSPEMQLPPPSRALGVANQELHPSLRHLLVQHARTHVPTQGVRMLELAAVSCDSGMPMILPRVSMLRSYLPMLLRFRQECDLDMHAIAAQRERLDPAALASAQVWMHNCNIWQRANERLNLLDDAVVKPVVAASASIRDIMVFNSLDRAYVAACGYDTEHIARFLTLAKSTLAYARAQSRGEFLATAQWVSECLRMLLDSLLTVVELRLQFLNARTVTIAYPPQAEKNTGGAPLCPSPALSPGLATALVCAKRLEENMALANVEALDTDTQEVITQWKGIVTVVVSDLTAGREPSGRGNMFEED